MPTSKSRATKKVASLNNGKTRGEVPNTKNNGKTRAGVPNAKTMAVLPMEYPPPVGSIWEAIEAARIKIRWSARTIGTQAGLSTAFYATLARTGWNAQASTRDAVVGALVAAGVPAESLVVGAEPPPLTARLAPPGRLSTVRDALYESHPKESVDAVIAGSRYIDTVAVNELAAFRLLDQQLRLEVKDAAPLGRRYELSSRSGELERFDADSERLGKRQGIRPANARK